MARLALRAGLGSLGIMLVTGSMPLAGQALGLPASDPVGIGRSGAQVAYGRSLEAASLNPALLVTVPEPFSVHLALGFEGQATQETLKSTNSAVMEGADRSRSLAGFGLGWKLSPTFALGLKADQPYLRHASMPDGTSSRFLGRRLDLVTHREELQLAWASTPKLSFGASLGVVQVTYLSIASLRAVVPGTQGGDSSLVEQDVRQEGKKTVHSWSVGFRYAFDSRWTVGGVYQGALRADLGLKASLSATRPPIYYNNQGTGPANLGTEIPGGIMLAQSTVLPGEGNLDLPAQANLGVRHRVNQVFTWEADLHYVGASGLHYPGLARLQTPYGITERVDAPYRGHSTLGVRGMGEVALGRLLTARVGFALEPTSVDESRLEPLTGGMSQAAFSLGLGYRIWGGELNVGYQIRQTKDTDSTHLNGDWRASGYHATTDTVRVEGMGHLLSIGFRTAF
jgi:long-subunit fatty acid transport protein